MAAELSRPGVEVVQVFRATSPTVVTPTLVPNVTGVCKQLVEVLESDGAGGNTLNSDALVTLPALATAVDGSGSPAEYTGLDGLALVFSVNGGPDVTVTFSDPTAAGLTPATVVSQVNDALATAGVTAVLAETIGDAAWQLRTVGIGEFQAIVIKSTSGPAVLTAFGFGSGKTYVGLGSYNQYIVGIPAAAFPDPRDNLSELSIIQDSIRVFLSTGNGSALQELSRTKALLRSGLVDDPARVVGTIDLTTLTYPAGVTGLTITIIVNGTTASHTVASPASAAAFAAELDTAFAAVGVSVSVAPTTNFLRLQTDALGADQSLEVDAGTLLAAVGITAGTTDTGKSIEAVDDGNGDAVTPLIKFAGDIATPIDFTAAATAAAVTGSGGTYPLVASGTLVLSDGNQEQTIQLTAAMTAAAVVTAINAVMGAAAGGKLLASSGAEITLTHLDTGIDSVIRIVGGTSLAALGLTAGFYRGIPGKPEPGDELWIDGEYYADIVERAPGGQVSTLKINRQVAISTDVGANFYIVAKNLTSPPAVGRPRPELSIDLNGAAVLKQEVLYDTTGTRTSVKAPVYLAYTAVRKDVTSVASQPGLLRFDDTTQLDEALAPLSTDNPLALGLYFALLNAPGTQVTGLGVDEISDDSPFGTVEAFTRAAEYLEAYEVYGIAPLTHDDTVHQVFYTHVSVMSESENKGERIVLINPSLPTNRRDTLVASGTDGDRLTTTTFDTKITNLTALVLNAGINPIGTIPVSAGLFLDAASDSKRYSISSISGSVVTTRTSFAAGENDDSYYTTDTLPATMISEAYSVKVRGTALTTVSGQPDNQGIAETIQALGQAYKNRRVWMVVPDQCAATIDGLEQTIDGFYMCAAIAGMIGQQPPQQSFTNFPMTGFTRVIGSNDRFSQRQINIMAAGGAWVVVQDAQGAPLYSQFALTTDLTSVETRTDSITKVVDFTAKFLRRGLKNFIGRFNITQGFLDTLGSVIQGLLGFLIENGVLIGAQLNNIVQDTDAPDTVLVDITLDVPYPCNFIRLTLLV